MQEHSQAQRRKRFLVPSLIAMAMVADSGFRSVSGQHGTGLAFLSSLITALIITVPLLAILSSPSLLFKAGRTMDGWLKAYGYAAAFVIVLLIVVRAREFYLRVIAAD